MRLFLAVDLADKIKKSLDSQLIDIKDEYPQFNWIPRENFHITLLFFGEIRDAERLRKRIGEIIWDASVFTLYGSQLDLFINEKIVLYLGFEREKKLEQLVNKLRSALAIAKRNKFIPHLTFAKARIPSKQQYLHLKKKLKRHKVKLEIPVKKIYLFESILTGNKPVYKKIAEFDLN